MMAACIDYIFYLEKFKVTRILSNPMYDKTLDNPILPWLFREQMKEQKVGHGKLRTNSKYSGYSVNYTLYFLCGCRLAVDNRRWVKLSVIPY